MTYLQTLKHHPKAKRPIKRVGRGPASGQGKTAGRGHKGQMARGPGPRPGFEGGQMPLIRTLPKIGFSARAKVKFQVVNVADLEASKETENFGVKELYALGLISSRRKPVKLLAQGELKRKISVKVHAASRSAAAKVEKAGGTVEILKSKGK